jgi:Tfp pilus assembly protein PilX
MRKRIATPRRKQQGAILIIALMFLIAITLYTLSSMRSSNIGLYLAHNEESRVAAEQAAQALADAIVSTPASTPVVGQSGFTACTAGQSGCNRTDLAIVNATLASQVAANHMQARVERTGSEFQPPPRAVETSIDKFTSATFRVTTTFDRVGEGLGREQVTEGVLVLVPKL